MPHHGVVCRDAVTVKLRGIFDTSYYVPVHPSLSSGLLKGRKLDVAEPCPLTPVHFWLGKSNMCLLQKLGLPEPLLTGSDLHRRARHRKTITERLGRRWKWEYLLLL